MTDWGGERAGRWRFRRSEAGVAGAGFRPFLERRLEAEADRLFLWFAVLFGVGIAAYFALPREPAAPAAWAAALLATVWSLRPKRDRLAAAVSLGCLAVALGFLVAGVRTAHVEAPVVAEPLGAVDVVGRVVSLDPEAAGSRRMIVHVRRIGERPADETPARISVRLRVDDGGAAPGDPVRLRAVLLPPPDASEPGGFDYARQAFFERIGAVGFLVAPPEVLARETPPSIAAHMSAAVERLRVAVSERIQARIGGQAGGIAAALVTGHRGGISEDAQEALRAAGLAHILAISGLHMMLVVGTIFVAVRGILALSPRLALTRPIKKWAAVAALLGGAAYLLVSGGSIATQRAFVMATIMLVAVLFDRPAITLRNVAIAALVVLVLTPEALISASFQMSFAATVALVAGYEALRERRAARPREPAWGALRTVRLYVAGLVLTSLVAGVATGPYAAFHFNRVAVYGLLGNVAAMPLVGFVVMPAGLAAMCLMPLGLEGWALDVMGHGIDAVVAVARLVAGLDGAVHMVSAFSPLALALMTVGGLWLALWRTRWRHLGTPLVAAGALVAAAASPPDLLVARDLRLVALRGDDGRLVFAPAARSGYVVDRWLRVSGDTRRPPDPALTAGTACDDLGCVLRARGVTVAYAIHPAAFEDDCVGADVVVARIAPPAWCGRSGAARLVIGPDDAERHGAMAIRFVGDTLHVDTAASRAGRRPWNRRAGGDPPAGAMAESVSTGE